MTARGKLIGLLAAFAMLAAFAFTTGDRAGAETLSVGCYAGHWALLSDGTVINEAVSPIPCTEPIPGWVYASDGSASIVWVPAGDSGTPGSGTPGSGTPGGGTPGGGTPGGGTSGGGTSGGGTSGGGTSGSGTSGTGPSGTGLSDTPANPDFLYEADENNRAVRAADGRCYRQQRLNGQWRRSGSYGSTRDACRQASWNAYYRSQRLPLVSPGSGRFESGWPPGATIWSSTLTVGAAGPQGASRGCSDTDQCGMRLTDASFTYEGTEYRVEGVVYDPATGTLTFTLDQEVPEELTLHVGDLELAFADADSTEEGTASWAVEDLDWTPGLEVSLRLTT